MILLLRVNDPTGPGYLNPRYNSIIYRKHYKDLRDIIAKMQMIYPLVDPGAQFHKQDLTWTFTSGARIQVAYFETREQCESMVQGAEYATVICDEAMHFSDDSIFLYMMSRLRNTYGMKCLMRLTSNPGRFPWLRSFFKIDDVGTSTDFIKEYVLDDGTVVKKRIKYIQAKLSDNPHLPKEYAATIMMLSEEDKLALLDGMWNAYSSIDGQIYEHELDLMTSQRRFCHVPFDPSVSVETYFDIGMSDLTVILFIQRVGKEIRIIDMLKGNNNGLGEHWVPEILRLKETKGYRYAKHYLPHDAAQRDKWNGISLADKAKASLRDVEVLPRLSMEVGLQLTREMFRNVWIDKDSCADLHTDLSNYRREWDPKLEIWKDEPLHDKHSHGADAFRMISYYRPKSKLDISDMDSVASSNPFTFR